MIFDWHYVGITEVAFSWGTTTRQNCGNRENSHEKGFFQGDNEILSLSLGRAENSKNGCLVI